MNGATSAKSEKPYKSMSTISKPERVTQERVIALFRDQLRYDFLGDWTERQNSNIEEEFLRPWLQKQGNSPEQISRALELLQREAGNTNRALYANNQAVYGFLRYGVPVQTAAGQNHQTIALIDWKNPENNDFAIAEEVTLRGNLERRPDLVLYINGIALGVLELKNSRVSIGDGIRQSLSNQQPEFNAWFFSTVQLIMAGNDSEGLQYGTILTSEKYFLKWKEDEQENDGYKLDKYLKKICRKERLLELIHDFILFDNGIKKVPRVHQYFGIKAAQEKVSRREGGIIWHTQGSGKSIVMVLLAKWILENNPNSRVVIITDRDELDKQIERVFESSGQQIHRTNSERDLMTKLSSPSPRLLCSLIHKFARRDVDDFKTFISELESQPSRTVGEVFVFVDECHRTQSGKLHRVMKAMMPEAVFIGFTGTPLLKQDSHTSLEVFGGYIHTYKFSEAVEDEVVLDLIYEARDIDQRLGNEDQVDAWFDAKTKGLNEWQKAELRKKWGTMQTVLSSRSRKERVVQDIIFDFSVKPRLSSERGNAILVASSIYDACKYYTLFQNTPMKGKCALVTSYNPNASDVTTEESGANSETDKQFIYNTYTELLRQTGLDTEGYEDEAKKRFIKEPTQMKLLIVVDKLLTGFDAPPCTYLYIDKSMQDHGLFQAICRTNRLDGEDKEFGYIVDYCDLFKKVENAIAVYTAELDRSAGGVDPDVLLKDRLKRGRERLDDALEALQVICEPVLPPRADLDFIHYFCGNTEIASDLKEREPQRDALYKGVVALIRAYAGISDEMPEAGYSQTDCDRIAKEVDHYLKLREVIRKASGESIDLKAYEADMRHLIDTYIETSAPRTISPFEGMPLIEIIVKSGIAKAIAEELSELKGNEEAVSETIENNVRSKIIKEHLNDPAFYDRMSALLDELIKARKEKAIAYEEYLKQIKELTKRVVEGREENLPEPLKQSAALRALYNNLQDSPDGLKAAEAAGSYGDDKDRTLTIAIRLHDAIKANAPADFRGNVARERAVKRAMFEVLMDQDEVERLFPIIKSQREY
jgi:type I restriction enzyme R subunit